MSQGVTLTLLLGGAAALGLASILGESVGLAKLTLLGVGVAALSAALGLCLAITAAFGHRAFGRLLARAVEFTGMLPTSIGVILALTASPTLVALLVVLSAMRGVRIARVLRGELLRLEQEPWSQAARALGASLGRQLRRGYLPALAEPLAVEIATGVLWTVAIAAVLRVVQPELQIAGAQIQLTNSAELWAWLVGSALIGAGSLGLLLPRYARRTPRLKRAPGTPSSAKLV